MTLASIIIPVSNYHLEIAQRAISSAEAQTVPSEVLVVYDKAGKGAGAARNEGASLALGQFLVFLDADDQLHPEFVERCARGYVEGAYMYTDWQLPNGEAVVLPNCTGASGWHEKRFHLVTTFLPRVHFEGAGGFDETIPALEDTALYLKLASMGVCGERIPHTLVTYHVNAGQRGRSARANGAYERMMTSFRSLYQGVAMGCGCGAEPAAVQGQKQEGDVAVFVQAQGNKTLQGLPGVERRYRGGNGKATWMSLHDALLYIKHNPKVFKLMDAQTQAKGNSPSRAEVLAALDQAFDKEAAGD